MSSSSLINVRSQKVALKQLAKIAEEGMISPIIRRAANQIVRDCAARDDICELNAIFLAVKEGTPNVPGLRKGVRYVADPRDADYYTGPEQLLKECAQGACAEDCDSQATLVCALAGALGFIVGLRAYSSTQRGDYEHVYPVAISDRATPRAGRVLGMDTTVPESTLGWEPPRGKIETAWIY